MLIFEVPLCILKLNNIRNMQSVYIILDKIICICFLRNLARYRGLSPVVQSCQCVIIGLMNWKNNFNLYQFSPFSVIQVVKVFFVWIFLFIFFTLFLIFVVFFFASKKIKLFHFPLLQVFYCLTESSDPILAK